MAREHEHAFLALSALGVTASVLILLRQSSRPQGLICAYPAPCPMPQWTGSQLTWHGSTPLATCSEPPACLPPGTPPGAIAQPAPEWCAHPGAIAVPGPYGTCGCCAPGNAPAGSLCCPVA